MKTQQDEIARADIERLALEYPLPESKTFSGAVTDANNPVGMRLIVREKPYVFVQDKG